MTRTKRTRKAAVAPVPVTTKYVQQVHAGCGGEIVVVCSDAIRSDWRLTCKTCKVQWSIASPLLPVGVLLPDDFVSFEERT